MSEAQEIIDQKKANPPLAVSTSTGDMIAMIERVVTNPDIDVTKIQALLDMKRQMDRDAAERAFNLAMSAAQSEIQPVARKTDADRYKFAEFDAIDSAIRPIYTRHGFALTFGSKDSAKGLCVTCTVLHKDGHSKDYELAGALDTAGMKDGKTKTEIQGTGSSASYLQKYLTRLIFNVVTKKDTDGAGAADQEPITTDQAAGLDKRLRAISDKALPNFLVWAKIEALTEIRAAKYAAAEKAVTNMEIEAKKKKGAA